MASLRCPYGSKYSNDGVKFEGFGKKLQWYIFGKKFKTQLMLGFEPATCRVRRFYEAYHSMYNFFSETGIFLV